MQGRRALSASLADRGGLLNAGEPRALCLCLLRKIEEQLDRLDHLIESAPSSLWSERPWRPGMTGRELLGHLLLCAAGFCAALAASNPPLEREWKGLRERPVDRPVEPGLARMRLGEYRAAIVAGFQTIHDGDLSRRVPTVLQPGGETLLALLLHNLEHLIQHKYQVFAYGKLCGVAWGTSDLYLLREPGQPG